MTKRAELLKAILSDQKGMIKDMADRSLKGFLRRYVDNFTSGALLRATLFRLCKDSLTTANLMLLLLGCPHVRIVSAKSSQALDMLYLPRSSVLYKEFLTTVAENAGVATIICVLGKRAVVLSNVSALVQGVDYYAAQKQPGALPDLFLLPWQQVVKHAVRVTQ